MSGVLQAASLQMSRNLDLLSGPAYFGTAILPSADSPMLPK